MTQDPLHSNLKDEIGQLFRLSVLADRGTISARKNSLSWSGGEKRSSGRNQGRPRGSYQRVSNSRLS